MAEQEPPFTVLARHSGRSDTAGCRREASSSTATASTASTAGQRRHVEAGVHLNGHAINGERREGSAAASRRASSSTATASMASTAGQRRHVEAGVQFYGHRLDGEHREGSATASRRGSFWAYVFRTRSRPRADSNCPADRVADPAPVAFAAYSRCSRARIAGRGHRREPYLYGAYGARSPGANWIG